jgi:uncharacterized protein YcgI (DUF1989 family)
MLFDFQFKTYWNSDEKVLKNLGTEFVKALMATGKTEQEAVDMVNQFQRESFDQGGCEEAYNNEDFS